MEKEQRYLFFTYYMKLINNPDVDPNGNLDVHNPRYAADTQVRRLEPTRNEPCERSRYTRIPVNFDTISPNKRYLWVVYIKYTGAFKNRGMVKNLLRGTHVFDTEFEANEAVANIESNKGRAFVSKKEKFHSVHKIYLPNIVVE